MGSFMQLLPILAVPFVAIVQSCRYLSNGPPDLFEVKTLRKAFIAIESEIISNLIFPYTANAETIPTEF